MTYTIVRAGHTIDLGGLPLAPDAVVDVHWFNQGGMVEPWCYDVTVGVFAACCADNDPDEKYLVTDQSTGLIYEVHV